VSQLAESLSQLRHEIGSGHAESAR